MTSMVPLNLTVPPKVKATMSEIALKENRTPAYMVRVALAQFIERYCSEKKQPKSIEENKEKEIALNKKDERIIKDAVKSLTKNINEI